MSHVTRIRLLAILVSGAVLFEALPGSAQDSGSPFYYCCIMDAPPESIWELGGSYALPADNDAAAWDDVSILEFIAWAGLLYFETDTGGDFDVRVQSNTRILEGFDGTASSYPLVMANLFVQYSQRFEYGYGLRIDFSPGLYSDFKDFGGEDFAFPFGISGMRAFNEEFSILLGLSVFPGFDRPVDPRVGLRWVPQGLVLVDLFYPESRISFDLAPGFGLHAGFRFQPWLEYQLDDDDPRDRLRYDESRLYGGVHFQTSEYRKLSIDLGYMFDRKIEFEAVDPSVDLDDAPYFAVSYTSVF